MESMMLYIHIPFCVKKCPYCDFLSFPADEATQRAYVDALLREIAYYGGKCGDYAVTSVFFGGGTPSWLAEGEIERILNAAREAFHIDDDAEITVECNPGTVTEHKLISFRQAGVNRLSIGLQSAVDDELKMLGRIHTYAQFLKTFEMARRVGFSNISVDLIHGLPHQTWEDFSKTLQCVIRLRPEHISAYALMIEKGTPFYDMYKFDSVKQEAGMPTEALPDEDEEYRITKMTQRTLGEAGYAQYEISNFARTGYVCRHNIGYWKRDNYLGLGLGASSLMENIRYTNVKNVHEYIDGTRDIREVAVKNKVPAKGGTVADEVPATNLHESAERVSRKGQMEEFMFLGLRMNEGISRDDFARAFGTSVEGVYQDELSWLADEGLLEKRAGRIYLTERGQDLSNYVLARFML